MFHTLYIVNKIKKYSDFTLEEKNTDLIQTKFKHEESVINIEPETKYNDVYNSMCAKTKTFVNTVQMNSSIEMENVSDSNLISKNYGCICTCCHGNTFQRCECVIFLQHNYNLLIPSVTKTLSKRCKATKSKEFICKKMPFFTENGEHTCSKSSKMDEPLRVHDNDVIVDRGGEKNVKHNVKNEQVSIDLMQDPKITDQCVYMLPCN